MKILAVLSLTALLCACDAPHFVADAPPIPVTKQAPDHFEFPARIALARSVYGQIAPPSAKEAALWQDLADRAQGFGSFTPLTSLQKHWEPTATTVAQAREQRFNYLILVELDPTRGAAKIFLYDTGSGAVMATTQAVTERGGQKGFWGGRIHNPARLDRATLRIAKAAVPAIEELLREAAKRTR